MTAAIIDGAAYARDLKQEVAIEAKVLRDEGIGCALATLSVGAEYSADAYERRLRRVSQDRLFGLNRATRVEGAIASPRVV